MALKSFKSLLLYQHFRTEYRSNRLQDRRLIEFFFSGHQVRGSQGPVFVNSVIPIAATAASDQGNYVTQTVYGFLDFTTTIGNTIMVFSPQSAAAPAPIIGKYLDVLDCDNWYTLV